MGQLHRFQFKAMSAPCELQLYSSNQAHAAYAAEAVIRDVARIEQKYSRYRSDNLMFHINQAARQGVSVEVDDETAGLLDYAQACYQQSDGLFDISSGGLRNIWDFDSAQIPAERLITQQLETIGWDKVSWNQPLLEFKVAGMELDFGGIGKEYAADRAVSICRQLDVTAGLVDLGGDIGVIGTHPDQRPWRVGLRDAHNPSTVSGIIQVTVGAVATSGDYQRYMLVDGKRFSHIFNPLTGWPVDSLAAVTVVADHCIVAGSACTIAMLKGDKGAAWLKNAGFSHVWTDTTGNVGGNLNVHPANPACYP